ncbi:MAG: AAA family ATPase [Thermodesulfobacteriota bacterium]
MFSRSIIDNLRAWKSLPDRKPLILRGARQVGKTTAVELFAKEFDLYLYLNLEIDEDLKLFQRNLSIHDLYQSILLHKDQSAVTGTTLLFIDEIQNSPEAVKMLRFFYEFLPAVHVIAAGSLLEVMVKQQQISFPVGRVQFSFMYPLTFREFLTALGLNSALENFDALPLPDFAHPKLMTLFHRYTLIGGMPEIVSKYAQHQDIAGLKPLYQALLTSFGDDVTKYARHNTLRHIIRHCLDTAPHEAGSRIAFAGFGKSNYRSREVSEALKTLEQAMILYLLYPTTTTEIPIMPDLRKSPRLQFLDTGLLNFVAGLQGHFFQQEDLHAFYRGKIAEHIVGQELLAATTDIHKKPVFWVREKKQSSAEVDYLVQHNQLAIPVEVKSGKAGTLRSLHQFIDQSPHPYAVRLYSGKLELMETQTIEGRRYWLLNLPYFLAGRLNDYIDWMVEQLADKRKERLTPL